jgi:cytochrome c5
MKKLILLGLVVLFLLITACSSAESTTVPPAEGPDGKTLVEERCIGCHTLSRVISANHTADEWKEIVERMVVKGAELTEQEQQIVLDYLIATYPK